MGRGLKPAIMEVLLRVIIRVNLDEADESAENVLIRIARQSDPVDNVEKSLNRHHNHREICGPVSRTMPVSIRISIRNRCTSE